MIFEAEMNVENIGVNSYSIKHQLDEDVFLELQFGDGIQLYQEIVNQRFVSILKTAGSDVSNLKITWTEWKPCNDR